MEEDTVHQSHKTWKCSRFYQLGYSLRCMAACSCLFLLSSCMKKEEIKYKLKEKKKKNNAGIFLNILCKRQKHISQQRNKTIKILPTIISILFWLHSFNPSQCQLQNKREMRSVPLPIEKYKYTVQNGLLMSFRTPVLLPYCWNHRFQRSLSFVLVCVIYEPSILMFSAKLH